MNSTPFRFTAMLLGCALLSACCSTHSHGKVAPAPAPQPAKTGMSHTWMAFPTGDKATSVVLLERSMPREVVAGQALAYELRVTNLTSNQLREVVVRDQCADGFTLTESVPPAKVTPPSLLAWQVGDMAAGESRVIKVNGKVTSAGSFTSCADVSYNSLLCDTAMVVQPGLKLALSQTAESLLCDRICAKLTVSNPGSGTSRNVKVNYTLPAGWTTEDGRTTASWTVDVLGPGASKDFEVCVKSPRTGEFTGKATASADMGLSAESEPARTVVRQPVLVVKGDCPPKGLMTRNYTFRFAVNNKGDAVSNTTVVTAPLPAGTVFVSADGGGTRSGGNVGWNLGALKPGESRTVSYTVRADKAGTLSASATVTGECAAQVTDRCTVEVEGVPDIGTLLTDTEGVVLVGDPHVFRYEVRNQGQVNLTNVKVVAKLDENLEFVSSTAAGTPVVRDRTVEFNLGTVAVGQSRSFTITTRGLKAGTLFITTETSASEIARPSVSNEQVHYIDR